MLVRDLLSWISTQGAGEIWLVVAEENPRALVFWKRLGFSVERSVRRKTEDHEGLVWVLRYVREGK